MQTILFTTVVLDGLGDLGHLEDISQSLQLRIAFSTKSRNKSYQKVYLVICAKEDYKKVTKYVTELTCYKENRTNFYIVSVSNFYKNLYKPIIHEQFKIYISQNKTTF